MIDPAVEQEFIDLSTSVDVARTAIANGDSKMLIVSLKDMRKRLGRILKTVDPKPAKQIKAEPELTGAELPTEPPSPIKEGQV